MEYCQVKLQWSTTSDDSSEEHSAAEVALEIHSAKSDCCQIWILPDWVLYELSAADCLEVSGKAASKSFRRSHICWLRYLELRDTVGHRSMPNGRHQAKARQLHRVCDQSQKDQIGGSSSRQRHTWALERHVKTAWLASDNPLSSWDLVDSYGSYSTRLAQQRLLQNPEHLGWDLC